MKGFALILLSVILVVQCTNTYPQLRIRRNAKTDLGLSPEAANKRQELTKYLVGEVLPVVKDTVKRHKEIYEKVIKAANEAELKTDELKERLQKFTDIIDRGNTLLDTEVEELTLVELFELFGESASLADMYDDIDEPTKEETLIKGLLDENRVTQLLFQFLIDIGTLRPKFETHIQEYVDSLSEEDKLKDDELIEWFKQFKTTKDFESYVFHTMEVIEFLKMNSDEKKE